MKLPEKDLSRLRHRRNWNNKPARAKQTVLKTLKGSEWEYVCIPGNPRRLRVSGDVFAFWQPLTSAARCVMGRLL
jgi:hypothetical protein